MKIIYNEEVGIPIADYKIEEEILKAYNNGNDLYICNELVLYAVKSLIARGLLTRDKIEIWEGLKCLGKYDEVLQLETDISYDNYYVDKYLDDIIEFHNQSRKNNRD
jgi:hypothetical protein